MNKKSILFGALLLLFISSIHAETADYQFRGSNLLGGLGSISGLTGNLGGCLDLECQQTQAAPQLVVSTPQTVDQCDECQQMQPVPQLVVEPQPAPQLVFPVRRRVIRPVRLIHKAPIHKTRLVTKPHFNNKQSGKFYNAQNSPFVNVQQNNYDGESSSDGFYNNQNGDFYNKQNVAKQNGHDGKYYNNQNGHFYNDQDQSGSGDNGFARGFGGGHASGSKDGYYIDARHNNYIDARKNNLVNNRDGDDFNYNRKSGKHHHHDSSDNSHAAPAGPPGPTFFSAPTADSASFNTNSASGSNTPASTPAPAVATATANVPQAAAPLTFAAQSAPNSFNPSLGGNFGNNFDGSSIKTVGISNP